MDVHKPDTNGDQSGNKRVLLSIARDFALYAAMWTAAAVLCVPLFTQPMRLGQDTPLMVVWTVKAFQMAIFVFPLSIAFLAIFFGSAKVALVLSNRGSVKTYWIFLASLLALPAFWYVLLFLFPNKFYP